MSRHQIPRHAKRRLTIAAIAAAALIGTTVTVGKPVCVKLIPAT